MCRGNGRWEGNPYTDTGSRGIRAKLNKVLEVSFTIILEGSGGNEAICKEIHLMAMEWVNVEVRTLILYSMNYVGILCHSSKNDHPNPGQKREPQTKKTWIPSIVYPSPLPQIKPREKYDEPRM